jgi:hypothetical protein
MWFSRAAHTLGRFEVYTERDETGKGKVWAIRERGSNKPIWSEADLDEDGKPDVQTSYYRGKPVFEMYLSAVPEKRSLSYYGEDGKQKLLLADRRGDGNFSDRVIYGADKPRMEIWYNAEWTPIEDRQGRRGIILNGQWHHVRFTNGVWTPHTE